MSMLCLSLFDKGLYTIEHLLECLIFDFFNATSHLSNSCRMYSLAQLSCCRQIYTCIMVIPIHSLTIDLPVVQGIVSNLDYFLVSILFKTLYLVA